MAKGKGVILVTGATGQQGGAVARELLARKHTVRAMTRTPDGDAARALARQGAEVVKGDLNDAESLRRALQGAWGVFAVQNTWEAGVESEEAQGKRIAELARKAGVQHYVYTSVGSAHRKTGIPHFDNKWRIEETVRGLGFPSHVILRPVFFMDNFAQFMTPTTQDGTLVVRIPLPPGIPLQMIAVEDVGAVAAAAVAGAWLLAIRFESATYAQVLPGVGPTEVQYVLAAVIVAGLLLGSLTAMLGFRKVHA